MIHWLVAIGLIWLAWTWLKPRQPRRAAIDREAEARQILGVTADADDDAIRAAHRRLAAETHPDRGGSVERARQVNAARDVLLKRG